MSADARSVRSHIRGARRRHLFTKLGWRNAGSSLDLSMTHVEADLIGNGPAPVQLLASDREAVYTHPDRTRNALNSVALTADHRLRELLVEQRARQLR